MLGVPDGAKLGWADTLGTVEPNLEGELDG